MKKVSSTKDLPSWFDLKNYQCISKLSIDEIKEQINRRNYLLIGFEFDDPTNKENVKLRFNGHQECLSWEQIEKGDVIITEHRDLEMEELSAAQSKANGYEQHDREVNNLPSSSSISGFPSIQAYYHGKNLLDNELIQSGDENTYFKSELMLGDLSMINKKFEFGGLSGGAAIFIDLENNTDKEIKADLEKLLPAWREALEIDEPEGIYYSKALDYEKVASYGIIPLLDLMIWEKLTNQKIPLRVLVVALFPRGEKGENELKQTVIPLAMKLISDKYRHIS